MSTEPSLEGDSQQDQTPLWQTLVGAAVLLALVAAAALAVKQIYPRTLPAASNPSFVDNIFDSRVVILLIRVALIFAAGYVVISVVGLIVGRRWLAELGPFKASEPVVRLGHGAGALEQELDNAMANVKNLERSLFQSDEALARARLGIELLLDQIDRMEAKKEGQ